MGFYPLIQLSPPKRARGIPSSRWVYKEAEGALLVLFRFFRFHQKPTSFLDGRGKLRNSKTPNPWLVVVQLPSDARYAVHDRQEAYYLSGSWAPILSAQNMLETEEWAALEVQQRMLKGAASEE